MKQKIVLIIGISLSLTFGVEAKNDKKDTTMDRIETCKQNYTRLFGGEALSGKGSDPELMDILQKFIFGEVFETGSLDHKTREMITCVTLASMQTLPQLKSPCSSGTQRRSISDRIARSHLSMRPIYRIPQNIECHFDN